MPAALKANTVQAPSPKGATNVAKVYEKLRKSRTAESEDNENNSGGANKVKPAPIRRKRDKAKPAEAQRLLTVEGVTEASVKREILRSTARSRLPSRRSSRTELNSNAQVSMPLLSLLSPKEMSQSAGYDVVAKRRARSAQGRRRRRTLPRRPKVSGASSISTSLSPPRNPR